MIDNINSADEINNQSIKMRNFFLFLLYLFKLNKMNIEINNDF